jgi:hypothetical protein
MFGLDMLDVMIGLVTVYLSFGIACTACVEAISSAASLRSKNLQAGLGEFLKGKLSNSNTGDNGFLKAFYAHPLIQTLSKGEKGRPSYIPAELVGRVVTSILENDKNAASLKDALDALPGENPGDNRVKDLLLELYSQAQGNVQEFKSKVEAHFDLTMERVAGWFKREAQFLAIIVSLILVGFANVDTIDIARSLASDPEARATLVASAENLLSQQENIGAGIRDSKTPDPTSLKTVEGKVAKAQESYDKAVAEIKRSGLKLGWEHTPDDFWGWVTKFFGLIVSALAVSLGAPFWFQLLDRFMKVRGAGKAPDTKA